MVVLHFILLCFVLGANAREPLKPFISGGLRERKGQSPWHAGIYKKTTTPYMQICGGTLISKNVVVSAAHCFGSAREVPSASDYAVAVGKIYRPWNDKHDTGAQKSDVKEIKIPKVYQGSAANYQEDIALVIASEGFHYSSAVMPACLSFEYDLYTEQLKEGNVGKVAGWGFTGKNSLASQVLQYATLPVIAPDKCIDNSPLGFRSSITGDKLCAGYTNGTAVCHGDSGGGLLFPKKVGNKELFYLRGVVSTAPPTQDNCNVESWATFTNIFKHMDFIKSVVTEPEDNCFPEDSDEGSAVDDRFTPTERIPRIQRCECQCPRGTTKHGRHCIRTD